MLAWMWPSLFDALIFMMFDIAICVWIFLDFKVQMKSGFLYDILVYWIASHWSDLFNS